MSFYSKTSSGDYRVSLSSVVSDVGLEILPKTLHLEQDCRILCRRNVAFQVRS